MSVPTAGRTLHIPDRGSFFVRTATGPMDTRAVVLLHGLGATADLNWSTAIPELSRFFRVVAPDLRGHGRAITTEDRFTLEDAADDIAAIADALSLGPFIVVGYSMGGAIAQLVCRRHPDQVRGLVLCATSRTFRGTWRERMLYAALPAVGAVARAVPDEIGRSTARLIAEHAVGGLPEIDPDCEMRRFGVRHFLDALFALGAYCSDAWISSIDVPSAVLVHLRDQLVPPQRQFALARALPGSRVHPIDGDHFAAVKKPGEFVTTLSKAVREVHRRHAIGANGRSDGISGRRGIEKALVES